MVLIRYLYTLNFILVLGHAIRKGKFPSPPTPSEYCLVRNVSCIDLPQNQRTCLSTALTYQTTSLIFAEDSRNLSDVFDKLQQWSALKAAPECWNVVQSFLCSVYLPKCESGTVERSSFELCQRTREPCQIVADHIGWPYFLQCEALHFQPGCYPTAARHKFNRSSSCVRPLMASKHPSSDYESIKGCGLQCQNPMFTKLEHDQVHTLIAVMSTICLLCALFAVLTFLIDWKSARKYPSLILFFINISVFFSCIGWMLQFSGLRESIVCRSDGTIRLNEPKMSEGESPWCTVIFFIVYFFTMSGVMWFVTLSYSWYLNFRSLGARNSHDEIEGKTTYFHIFAWALPLVLAIVAIAVGRIEGDSLSGICFVGYYDHGLRAGLVLAPVGTALVVGLYFLLKGVLILVRVRQDCPDFVCDRATSKIKFTIIRVAVFTFLSSLFVFASFFVHIYVFTHEFQWRQSLKNYIVCLARNESGRDCVIESRPHLGAIQLNIFTFFGAGIVMSSWVWTKATFRTWKRFLSSILSLKVKDPIKIENKKAVAEVIAQRRDDDRPSSLATTQDDPIGMNFDFNSASSRPASSVMFSRPTRHRRPPPRRYNVRRYSDSDAQSVASYISRRISGESVRMPESSHRNSFYSRHHAEDGLDVRAWAKNAAKWTRKTRVKPVAAPTDAFHKQRFKIHKRHEAALERAARNSEVSSISDGVSELSSAVFDRNAPLPPIGHSQRRTTPTRKPDYSIFTASAFGPGELKKVSDPLNPELPGSVNSQQNSERPVQFKRPMTAEALDFDDDSIEDVSVLEM